MGLDLFYFLSFMSYLPVGLGRRRRRRRLEGFWVFVARNESV
jgi:hypothetical protein